jgi:hypothetical protein
VVQSATLHLYANTAAAGRTLQVLRITKGWTETGVTWRNQPATTGPAALAASGSGYRQWDVSAHVLAHYSGAANHGFLIRDAKEKGTGEAQQFHSRENGANRPMLVITFSHE